MNPQSSIVLCTKNGLIQKLSPLPTIEYMYVSISQQERKQQFYIGLVQHVSLDNHSKDVQMYRIHIHFSNRLEIRLFTSIFLSTIIPFFNRSAANDWRIPCNTWIRKIKPVGTGNGIVSDVSPGEVVSFKQSTCCKNTGNSPTYQHGDQNLRWNRQ